MAPVQRVSPAIKTLEILEALAEHPAEGLSLTQVAGAAHLSKSTAYRFLRDLAARRYVRRDDTTRRYRLGYPVLGLSVALLESIEVRTVARPHLERLMSATGETVHLVQRDGEEAVYVDIIPSPQPVGLLSRVGKRRPLHCTGVGKVLLAFDPEAERLILARGELPRYTATTLTSPSALKAELAGIRVRGYALDNGEHREGIVCVAGPLFDAGGHLLAAVSIAGPSFRFSLDRARTSGPFLLELCQMISRDCGFRGRMATGAESSG